MFKETGEKPVRERRRNMHILINYLYRKKGQVIEAI